MTKFGTNIEPPPKLLKYLTHQKKQVDYTVSERVRINVRRKEYLDKQIRAQSETKLLTSNKKDDSLT